MPKSGETRAVREVKEAMAKAKAKRQQAVEKPVDQKPPMDTPECPMDRKPTVSNEASIGHSTVSSVDTQEFPITRLEHQLRKLPCFSPEFRLSVYYIVSKTECQAENSAEKASFMLLWNTFRNIKEGVNP